MAAILSASVDVVWPYAAMPPLTISPRQAPAVRKRLFVCDVFFVGLLFMD